MYTPHESEVLARIARHEMNPGNGARPTSAKDVRTWVWVRDFSDRLSASQVKGVLASLVKKGLIVISYYDARDNSVAFTDLGFAAWQANDVVAQD